MTQEKADRFILQLSPNKRYRWCEPGPLGCACLGCSNISGGLARLGVKKEQWQDWVKRNPQDKN